MTKTSLSLRLALSSALWIVGTLAITGALIVFLFKGHIEKRFDGQLTDHLEELVAASEISPEGRLVLTWTPADPRFNRPHSGWYWEILENGDVSHQSGSLLTARLIPLSTGSVRQPFSKTIGPSKRDLRLHAREIMLPRLSEPLVFAVAGPISDINEDIERFAGSIAVVLTVLAGFLVGIVILQVRFGLKPLRRVRQSLSAIRDGRTNRLPSDFPTEVQPLVLELNALLDYNAALLKRARTQVGNLAHSLKNPIAVLKNEMEDLPGEKGRVARHQVNAAAESIDRYLHRARIAGTGNLLGARTHLKTVAEDIRFSLAKLYANRSLEIRFENLDGVIVQVEPEDMEELLGNLLDNACKWAAKIITVSAVPEHHRVAVIVEDDGPGIPAEQLEGITKRGLRLDETKPGSGLGLGIVKEIAELYGGELAFEKSTAGGLLVRITLPLAAEIEP